MQSSYGYDPNLYVGSFDIETLAKQKGFLASNATRLVRKLAQDGILERKLFRGKNGVKVAYYRWINKYEVWKKKPLEEIIDYYSIKFNEKRI